MSGPGTLREPSSLADHAKQQRTHRLTRIFVGIGVVAVLLAAGITAWFSPVLALSSVTVDGATLTNSQQVKSSVLSTWKGTPLPQIRLGAVQNSLHSEFPKTREVKVRWSGPHSLRVTITDRTPVVAKESVGRWQRYDDQGALIDSVGSRPEGLAVLRGSSSSSASALRAAVTMLNQLPSEARSQIVSVQAGSADDLRVVYAIPTDAQTATPSSKQKVKASEVEIRFGDASDIANKFASAKPLLSRTTGYVDVSVPSMPTTGK